MIDRSARCELFQLLRAAILRDGRTQKEIAQAAGVTQPTIHNWLWGSTISPRLNTIVAVADALGFDIVLQKAKRLRRAA